MIICWMQNRQTAIESMMCSNYIVSPDSIHENDDKRRKKKQHKRRHTLNTESKKKNKKKNDDDDDRDVTLKRFTRNVCSIFSCWRQIPITHILLGNARLYVCWARFFSDISRIYILIWDVCCLWMVEFTRFIAAHSWGFFFLFFFSLLLLLCYTFGRLHVFSFCLCLSPFAISFFRMKLYRESLFCTFEDFRLELFRLRHCLMTVCCWFFVCHTDLSYLMVRIGLNFSCCFFSLPMWYLVCLVSFRKTCHTVHYLPG